MREITEKKKKKKKKKGKPETKSRININKYLTHKLNTNFSERVCCNHIKEQSIIITKSKLCGIKSHTKISIEYEAINKQMMKHTQHRHYSPSLVNTT